MTGQVLVTADTIVSLHPDDGTEVWAETWRGTLSDFIASNDMEADEAAEITKALNHDGVYDGGGGAVPEFCLMVEEDPQ
jgi:hypothetical protein